MKSLMPDSAVVGMSGNVGHRSLELTASARTLPARIRVRALAMLSIAKSMSPAINAISDCAPPGKGTAVAGIPVWALNSTDAR